MPKKNKDEIIEGAVAGGAIGAALGALLTGRTKGAVVSALVGAAIGASLKAIKEAEDLDTPVLYEFDGVIYRVHPDGRREKVKQLSSRSGSVPNKFTLD